MGRRKGHKIIAEVQSVFSCCAFFDSNVPEVEQGSRTMCARPSCVG